MKNTSRSISISPASQRNGGLAADLKWQWLYALLLFAVTLVAYAPAWNGKPIMDDMRHLTSPSHRSLAGLGLLWTHPNTTQQYHPLVDTFFWVENKLWGQSMLGHHIANIAVHACAALLLWKILERLAVPGSWFAAAIFALHPVQVESVAFLVELKNTLSAVFFFGCILIYLRFDQKRARKDYVLVLGLFLLGLLAKTVVALFPVTMILLFWWKRQRVQWKRDVIPLLPFVILGAASAVATGWMEREFSGAKGEGFDFSKIDRVLIAGRGFLFYLGKIFWPNDLMLIYPRWNVSETVWWQYLFPAATLILLATAWILRKRWPWFLAGLIFFTVTMIPTLGFFNLRLFRFQFVADHFQYLPMIGIVTPVAAGAAILLNRWGDGNRIFGHGLSIAILGTLTVLTWRQSAMFQDAETCYRTVIERNPNAWAAQNNYGDILLRKGRTEEAITHFAKVLQINPKDSGALKGAHLNLGTAFLQKRMVDIAIEHFERALQLQPDYKTYNSLGSAYHRKNRLPEAIAYYEKAITLEPLAASPTNNLAWILATCSDASLRDGARAVQLAQRAERLSGGRDPLIIHTLAAAHAETGGFTEAIQAAQRAMRIAEDQGNSGLSAEIEREIDLYKSGLPYRERPE